MSNPNPVTPIRCNALRAFIEENDRIKREHAEQKALLDRLRAIVSDEEAA